MFRIRNYRFHIKKFQKIFFIVLLSTNWAFGNASVIPKKLKEVNGSENPAVKSIVNSTQTGSGGELVASEDQLFYGYPQNYPWAVSYIPVQYVPKPSPPKVHTTGPKAEFELVNTKPGNLGNRLTAYPGYQLVYV